MFVDAMRGKAWRARNKSSGLLSLVSQIEVRRRTQFFQGTQAKLCGIPVMFAKHQGMNGRAAKNWASWQSHSESEETTNTIHVRACRWGNLFDCVGAGVEVL